jgi:glutathione S-transferase
MGIKLYYNPLSTFSRRVLIAFAEKQIPHELVVVDMAARQHRQQPYLSLNPYGRVPTLEEDDFVLFESSAILNHLEATRPTPPLVPADARGRAMVDMHMKLCYLQLTRYAGTIIFPKRYMPFLEFLPLMEIAPPEAVSAWSRRLLARPSARVEYREMLLYFWLLAQGAME